MTAFFKGMAFPFQKSEKALPAPVTDADLVKQSIQQILLTARGERVMRPLFGCDLQAYVFENNNALLGQLLKTEITAAIGQYEPRAIVRDIAFERSESLLTVTVYYTVVATQTSDSLQVAIPTATP